MPQLTEEAQEIVEEEQGEEYRVYPYGMLDFIDEARGVTLRFLNPKNLIIYVEIERLFGWFTAENPNADKSQSITDLKNTLVKEIAQFWKLKESQLTATVEPIWVGKELKGQENVYEIVTTADQEVHFSHVDAENEPTAAQHENVEEMVKVITDFISEKVDFVRENGEELAKQMEISFSENVDFVYTTYETSVMGGGAKEEDLNEDQTIYAPKPPIIIQKIFVSVYAQKAIDVKDTKSVSKSFYEFLSSCTDNDGETKTCSTAEWKSQEKPLTISLESQAKEASWATFQRLTITLNKNAIELEESGSSS